MRQNLLQDCSRPFVVLRHLRLVTPERKHDPALALPTLHEFQVFLCVANSIVWTHDNLIKAGKSRSGVVFIHAFQANRLSAMVFAMIVLVGCAAASTAPDVLSNLCLLPAPPAFASNHYFAPFDAYFQMHTAGGQEKTRKTTRSRRLNGSTHGASTRTT